MIAKTRAPIQWKKNTDNWFFQKFSPNPNQGDFGLLLQSLADSPPNLWQDQGFIGLVPFDWGYRGAIRGSIDPILGGLEDLRQPPGKFEGYGRLSPTELNERFKKLKQYVKDLHEVGVKRVMPYMDMGTQLFGRHKRPKGVPESAWGFWEFYDHLGDYAAPNGPFKLQLHSMPDPTTWLAKWHDPDGKSKPDLPDELVGLSFTYGPIKPAYGPYVRYSVCFNTLGWTQWWGLVVQWAAHVGYDGVFIDNSFMPHCWNQECQSGYVGWLQQNFTADQIKRYFRTVSSNLLSGRDPSIEQGWHQAKEGEAPEQPEQWRTSYWAYWPDTTSHMFPDIDAPHGRYSCRIEASGSEPVHFRHVSLIPVPAEQNLVLTFYYKTEGSVAPTLFLEWDHPDGGKDHEPLTLDPAKQWTQFVVNDIGSPPATNPKTPGKANLTLRFVVTGTGKVWVDDFWLGFLAAYPPESQIRLWTPSDIDPLHFEAIQRYWSFVADDKLGYLRQQGKQINKNFELHTNGFHAVNADFFMLEARAIEYEGFRADVGLFPGVYQSPQTEIRGNKPKPKTITAPLVITNIFHYKYIHSQRVPGFFGYHVPQWYLGKAEPKAEAVKYILNHDSALLNLAEAAAFGGGAGCDAAQILSHSGLYGYSLSLGAVPSQNAQKIRAVEQKFWKFIEQNEVLYAGYLPHADVGLVVHNLPARDTGKKLDDLSNVVDVSNPNEPEKELPAGYANFHLIEDLAKDLASRGVLWDLLTENRCNGENFKRLGALVYQDISRISEAEVYAIQTYLEQGGLVLAAGIVGDDDEWFRMRFYDPAPTWPPVGKPTKDGFGIRRDRHEAFSQQIGAGKLIYHPDQWTANQAITAVEDHLQRTTQMIKNIAEAALTRLRLNAWISDDNAVLTLHIVNYNVRLGESNGDQMQSLNRIQVSVPLPPRMTVRSVQLFSPESRASPQAVAFNVANGLVTFAIPSLRIYTVAVLE